MIAEERWSRILDLVDRRGVISIPELVQDLGTSESTIRRDLTRLDALGRLTKVHGGATSLQRQRDGLVLADQSFTGRMQLRTQEKRAIGAYAASLIGPDDFVFIDGGTTTEALVDAIGPTTATFLTNSLPHAQRLLSKGLRTLLPGGELKQTTEVLVGAETVSHIRRYHFTLGFWGTNGMSVESGYMTPEFSEAAVKQISLEQTQRRYVLADSSKFSLVSLITFADFGDATVITDRVPDVGLEGCDNIIAVDEGHTDAIAS